MTLNFKVDTSEVDRALRILDKFPAEAKRARSMAARRAADTVITKVKSVFRQAGLDERVNDRRIFNYDLPKSGGARAWVGLNPVAAGYLVPRSQRSYGRHEAGDVVVNGTRYPHSFWLVANGGQVAMIRNGPSRRDIERLLIPIHDLVDLKNIVNNRALQQAYLAEYDKQLRRVLGI